MREEVVVLRLAKFSGNIIPWFHGVSRCQGPRSLVIPVTLSGHLWAQPLLRNKETSAGYIRYKLYRIKPSTRNTPHDHYLTTG